MKNELVAYIPKDATILNSEIILHFNSKFVRVIFEISDQYMKEYNLDYKKRYIDVLLIPSKEYEGSAITGGAYTE